MPVASPQRPDTTKIPSFVVYRVLPSFFFQRLGCTSLRFLVGCRTRPSCTEFYWVSSIRVSPRNLLPFLSIFSIVSNELNLIDSCRTIDLMSNMKSQQQQRKEGKETLSISNFGQGQFNWIRWRDKKKITFTVKFHNSRNEFRTKRKFPHHELKSDQRTPLPKNIVSSPTWNLIKMETLYWWNKKKRDYRLKKNR